MAGRDTLQPCQGVTNQLVTVDGFGGTYLCQQPLGLPVLMSLAIELVNSAIEAVVDRVSLEIHPLSKRAKDLGSAAQLLGLISIAVVWLAVLL